MRLITLSTPLLLLIACGDKDTAINPTDTGEVAEEITYEAGCFVVDGGDGYKYLNDAIAVADEGSQISPVGCDSFEHEELVVIDKPVRLVGIGQDRFILVAPVNETAITITADNVEISDFGIQSTRSGIVIEGGNNVHLHDLTISEVGNYAIKTIDADVQLDDLTLWNNGDGAVNISGGSVEASGLDVRGNEGHGIYVDSGAMLTLSDSEVVEAQPTDVTAISDGFGVYVDGGSTLISSGNLYDGNTLMGVQSVNGTVEMTDDTVSGSLSTGIWAEGPGSLSLNNVTVDGNLTYGIISMTSGELSIQDVVVSVDPLMSPSYDATAWEENGFGSMGVFSNSNAVNINNLEITGYNNCGMNLQSEGSTAFTVEGLNVHDVGRKGIIVAGHTGTMNNVVIKDIFDLDGLSSTEPDENGNIPDVSTFCQTVDRNAGASIINADLTVSNVLTQDVQGFGWSVIQSNMALDTAFAQRNTCSSFLAFFGGIQGTNIEIADNNYVYDGLGAGVVGYEATLFSMENSTFRGTTTEVLDISAFLYKSTGTFTNNTFTGAGIALYSNQAEIQSTGNTFSEQAAYSAFLSTELPNGSEHRFDNDTFIGTRNEASNIPPVPVFCTDAGIVGVDGSSFTDVQSSYGMYLDNCGSEIENATFSEIDNYSIYAFNRDHDISDSSFTSVNELASYYNTIHFQGNDAMNINLADIEITNGLGKGVYAYSYNADTAPMNINISGLELNNLGNEGIYIGNATAFIEDVSIDGASNGISLVESVVDIANTSIVNTTLNGLFADTCETNIDTLSITTSATSGIAADGGTMTLNNGTLDGTVESVFYGYNGADVTIDGSTFQNGTVGLELTGTDTIPVTFAVTNSSFDLNSDSGVSLTYATGTFESSNANNNLNLGIECADTTITSCTGNDLSSNVTGEQSGCDETCGVEANPN